MKTLKLANVSFLLSGLSLSLASMPVLAITSDMPDQNIYTKEFKLLDTNNNGKLSATEIKKDELFNSGGFAKETKITMVAWVKKNTRPTNRKYNKKKLSKLPVMVRLLQKLKVNI